MTEIKSFSRGKEHLMDPKWTPQKPEETSFEPEETADERVSAQKLNEIAKDENEKQIPPIPHPPVVLIETKIPNILLYGLEDQWHSVVVVQHDDPERVAQIIESLRKNLILPGGEPAHE